MGISNLLNELRALMRAEGYDKTHPALQSLSQLRKALRDQGVNFNVTEATNVRSS